MGNSDVPPFVAGDNSIEANLELASYANSSTGGFSTNVSSSSPLMPGQSTEVLHTPPVKDDSSSYPRYALSLDASLMGGPVFKQRLQATGLQLLFYAPNEGRYGCIGGGGAALCTPYANFTNAEVLSCTQLAETEFGCGWGFLDVTFHGKDAYARIWWPNATVWNGYPNCSIHDNNGGYTTEAICNALNSTAFVIGQAMPLRGPL